MFFSTKWDIDYLKLAKFWAETKSKDPNKKVGAVLVRSKDKSIICLSYNGFPRQIPDDTSMYSDRDFKLKNIIHAEMNALLMSRDLDLTGSVLYTYPLPPCHTCAVHIIQSGVKRVVSLDIDSTSKWFDSVKSALSYFDDAGVYITLYKKEEMNE